MAMWNCHLKDPQDILLALDDLDFSDLSASFDSDNDNVISEGSLTDTEQEIEESSRIFAVEEKLVLAEKAGVGFSEELYNNVVEPESSLDNNEKAGKIRKEKGKPSTREWNPESCF